MKVLYEVGDRQFTGIRSAAKTTGAVKGHSNKGKSMVFKEYDPRMLPIQDHFNHLLGLGLGEVRVTRFIRNLVQGKEGNMTTTFVMTQKIR